MISKKIGIVDCNNFYVSCERVFNPVSTGRPTVVLSNNDGCVIARSQEAKDLGIKMGEPFFEKKEFMDEHKFCVYSSNYNLYGDMSDRVMSVIKEHVSSLEVYSIDEAFIDVSHVEEKDLMDFLHIIKTDVQKRVGIPVSIGVGPNKTLAKLTSHIAKQNKNYKGVCSFWDLEEVRNMYYGIDIGEVWGIGRKWKKKLNLIGIDSVGQFVNSTDGWIRKNMSILGLRTKYELLGHYCFPILKTPKTKKNVASARSFGQDIDDFSQIAEAMHSYIQNGIRKLVEDNLETKKATIFVSGNKHKGQNHSYYKSLSFQRSTSDVEEIWSQVYPELRKLFKKDKSYKKCGIVFSEITPSNQHQITLFQSSLQMVSTPSNVEKKWEMKQEFITKKYTTKWEDIPECFV